MGDCPYPFVGSASPPDVVSLVTAVANGTARTVTLTFSAPIVSGPTGFPLLWSLTGPGSPFPATVTIASGNIVLSNGTWGIGSEPTGLTYTRSGLADFLASNGAHVPSFSSVIPFP